MGTKTNKTGYQHVPASSSESDFDVKCDDHAFQKSSKNKKPKKKEKQRYKKESSKKSKKDQIERQPIFNHNTGEKESYEDNLSDSKQLKTYSKELQTIVCKKSSSLTQKKHCTYNNLMFHNNWQNDKHFEKKCRHLFQKQRKSYKRKKQYSYAILMPVYLSKDRFASLCCFYSQNQWTIQWLGFEAIPEKIETSIFNLKLKDIQIMPYEEGKILQSNGRSEASLMINLLRIVFEKIRKECKPISHQECLRLIGQGKYLETTSRASLEKTNTSRASLEMEALGSFASHSRSESSTSQYSEKTEKKITSDKSDDSLGQFKEGKEKPPKNKEPVTQKDSNDELGKYTDEDINAYLDFQIRYELHGFKHGCQFLLEREQRTAEDNPCFLVKTSAMSSKPIGLSTPIGYFFDATKQAKNTINEALSQLLFNKKGSLEMLKQNYYSTFVSFKDKLKQQFPDMSSEYAITNMAAILWATQFNRQAIVKIRQDISKESSNHQSGSDSERQNKTNIAKKLAKMLEGNTLEELENICGDAPIRFRNQLQEAFPAITNQLATANQPKKIEQYDEKIIDNIIEKLLQVDFDRPRLQQMIQNSTKDVFQELIPCMLQEKECSARIFFPYNIGNHWQTAEIFIEKKSNQSYDVNICSHDPYGGGQMDSLDYQELEDIIKKRIREETGTLQPEHFFEQSSSSSSSTHIPQSQEISIKNKKSPYNRRQKDSISCGAIVLEDILKLIQAESLNMKAPYEIGAFALRKQHCEFVEKIPDMTKTESDIKASCCLYERLTSRLEEAKEKLSKNQQKKQETPQDNLNSSIKFSNANRNKVVGDKESHLKLKNDGVNSTKIKVETESEKNIDELTTSSESIVQCLERAMKNLANAGADNRQNVDGEKIFPSEQTKSNNREKCAIVIRVSLEETLTSKLVDEFEETKRSDKEKETLSLFFSTGKKCLWELENDKSQGYHLKDYERRVADQFVGGKILYRTTKQGKPTPFRERSYWDSISSTAHNVFTPTQKRKVHNPVLRKRYREGGTLSQQNPTAEIVEKIAENIKKDWVDYAAKHSNMK